MLKLSKKHVQDIQSADCLTALFPLVQNAIELEHATIPPYLTAMFSLKPGKEREIWHIIHSIVIEEMMHMTIAANILNALGGTPDINHPAFVPNYPTPLPMGIGTGLIVTLSKYSRDQVKNVFMEIEEPENPISFPVNMAMKASVPDFHTIGEFYEALKAKINQIAPDELPGDPNLQVISPYYPSDLLFPILTKQNAMDAIDIIVEQGEGTETLPIDPEGEVAHYYKFEELYIGKRLVKDPSVPQGYSFSGANIPFDPDNVQPIFPDTKSYLFAIGSEERRRCDEFNHSYQLLLNALHGTFNGQPDTLGDAIGIMIDVKLRGEKICAMPFPGKPNTTIGPPFEFYKPMVV
ncbi:MAG: hypothetical protein ACJATI_004243 [Halioglobus sp.]|jgi:hypothetical protein